MKPPQLTTFEGLQRMATPVLYGKYACRGPGDKHGFTMQGERTSAIFGNVGKRRDGDFYGFSVLNQGGVQLVANPCKSPQKIALYYL